LMAGRFPLLRISSRSSWVFELSVMIHPKKYGLHLAAYRFVVRDQGERTPEHALLVYRYLFFKT
jgi:hypothetical protein